MSKWICMIITEAGYVAELSFEPNIRMKGVIFVFKNYGNDSILILSFKNPTAITTVYSESAPLKVPFLSIYH